MMSQLRDAFVSNLKDVHWMDEETKTKAVEKAENIPHAKRRKKIRSC